MSSNITKADYPEDPQRCQSMTNLGQCPNKRSEHSQYCHIHGGKLGEQKHERESLMNYNISKFKQELLQKTNSQDILKLFAEIAIMRLTLESLINQCQATTELIIHSQTISNLVSQISNLVNVAFKLENMMGNLLNKSALIQFTTEFTNIIHKYVDDKGVIEAISHDLLDLLNRVNNISQD